MARLVCELWSNEVLLLLELIVGRPWWRLVCELWRNEVLLLLELRVGRHGKVATAKS